MNVKDAAGSSMEDMVGAMKGMAVTGSSMAAEDAASDEEGARSADIKSEIQVSLVMYYRVIYIQYRIFYIGY